MDREIEEMITKGLAQPMKLTGTARGVFTMIHVLTQTIPLVIDRVKLSEN